MGFFDFLRRLFGGGEAGDPPPPLAFPAKALPPKPAPPLPPKKRAPPTSYEADFLPISDKELHAKAATEEVRTSPWWGRTDTIPPADDARTKLIDRALVTRGYLTPEQLEEIHQVGDLMLLKKGDEAMVRQEAKRAVERRKEERAARKAEMKRLAEERRRAHAAEVASRRATDILFLGRDVSGGLADRRSDVEKLRTAGLPILASPAEVAAAMGLTIPQLRGMAFHIDAATVTHYVTFRIPKKSGGMRDISAPKPRLATAQRWLLENVLSKIPVEPPAHGFLTGRSTVTNAAPHVRRAVVVNMDLKDFFPSITFPRVRGIFEKMGYSPAASTIFALLTTEAPRRVAEYEGKRYYVAIGPRGLPQGACSSPALSNLAAGRLDRRLGGLAAKLGWTYTRYADDLTFSGDTIIPKGTKDPKSVAWLLARTRHIISEESFEVNEKKLRVQRRNTAQVVTGIVVNDKPAVPRAERRRLRAALHRARFVGLKEPARVRGEVAYVSMVNAEHGGRLKVRLDALLKR
ncbi:MAG: RNA-directed DNA polymerase [Planctomycetes bacterium]|nr:RNA-directed DNA polymerase [Planctomycetota bacterium]